MFTFAGLTSRSVQMHGREYSVIQLSLFNEKYKEVFILHYRISRGLVWVSICLCRVVFKNHRDLGNWSWMKYS